MGNCKSSNVCKIDNFATEVRNLRDLRDESDTTKFYKQFGTFIIALERKLNNLQHDIELLSKNGVITDEILAQLQFFNTPDNPNISHEQTKKQLTFMSDHIANINYIIKNLRGTKTLNTQRDKSSNGNFSILENDLSSLKIVVDNFKKTFASKSGGKSKRTSSARTNKKTKTSKSVKAVRSVRSKSKSSSRHTTKPNKPKTKAKWTSTGNKAPIPSKDNAGKRQIVMRTIYACVEKPGEFRICKIDVNGKKKYVKVDLNKGGATPTVNSLINRVKFENCSKECLLNTSSVLEKNECVKKKCEQFSSK